MFHLCYDELFVHSCTLFGIARSCTFQASYHLSAALLRAFGLPLTSLHLNLNTAADTAVFRQLIQPFDLFPLLMITPVYLQTLGFVPAPSTLERTIFSIAWRYQNEILARDGATLFIEHPLGIDSCRLSALAAPLDARDVFASVALNDTQALEQAVAAFYSTHGGRGEVAPHYVPFSYMPYRRQ